jgi:trigger factor
VFYTVRLLAARAFPVGTCRRRTNQPDIETTSKDTRIKMPATVETIGPCRKKVVVNVEPHKVASAHSDILREVKKIATIPGFRPGKAPDAMITQKYGGHIDDQVRQRVIPESFRAALTEHKIHVVGEPVITKVNYTPGLSMTFEAEMDTAPEFPLPTYTGITVTRQPVTVTQEEIDRTIESLREQSAEFVDADDRPLATGDYGVISYTGVADGKPIKELAPDTPQLGEVKDIWLPIKSDAFLPGFCEQLLGMTKGEKRQVMVDIPADFNVAELAGKKAAYFVELTGIKQRKLPELNDEFAKKTNNNTVAELGENIRKMIEQDKEGHVKSEMRRQIMDYLMAQVTFDLPEQLVNQETSSIVRDVVRENVGRGATKEQLESQKDEILGFANRSARDRLKGSFILSAIATAEKIEATDAEVNERIATLARANRTSPAQLRAMLEKNNNLGSIEEQIVMSKTIDFLLSKATVESTK